MKITEFLKNNIVFLDGGMGTLLQERGLLPGELPERWNLDRPEEIVAIHRAYYDAGSHIVNTNTFGANILKFSAEDLDRIVKSAIENALSCENFFLIHGPFGTGKTRTLVELISQETRQGHKVLATAESNAAVDNILERLMENEKLNNEMNTMEKLRLEKILGRKISNEAFHTYCTREDYEREQGIAQSY